MIRIIPFIFFLFVPCINAGWVNIKKVQEKETTNWHEDVTNHRQLNFQNFENGDTYVHENTHLINGDVSNELTVKRNKKTWFFYMGNSKGFAIDEPKITKSQVKEFIPDSLKGDRHHTYLEKKYPFTSPDGNYHEDDTSETRPTLLLDEWVSYTNGTLYSIWEQENKPNEILRTNSAEACLEFSIYAIAYAMALEKYDKEFFKNNKDFKIFFKYQMERALRTYKESRKFDKFVFTKNHYHNLPKDGKNMIDFLEKNYQVKLNSW